MEACSAYVAKEKPACNDASSVYKIINPVIQSASNNQQESFFLIPLDYKKHMIGAPVEIFRGVVNACYISPRDIFQKALLANAAAIIVAHNHPSGNPEPSEADWDMTKKLIIAGNIIGIEVVDHLIIGNKTHNYEGFINLRRRKPYLFEK